jgi:hypothetical protein
MHVCMCVCVLALLGHRACIPNKSYPKTTIPTYLYLYTYIYLYIYTPATANTTPTNTVVGDSLSELSIASRIMRKDNYLIALVNQVGIYDMCIYAYVGIYVVCMCNFTQLTFLVTHAVIFGALITYLHLMSNV